MELFRLDYVLHEPCKEQGWLYMPEIPELPGCRAWAETSGETLAELSTVAEQFIISYKDRGKPLPDGIAGPLKTVKVVDDYIKEEKASWNR